MALSVDWGDTFVITVPKADLTLVSGTLYELDVDAFRLELKALEDDEVGMAFPYTHNHNTEVVVAGTAFSRVVEIVAPYSVEFEDGAYSVRLVGANNNIFDVENGILVQNQVQVIPSNSAGLIVRESGTSGLTPTESTALVLIRKLLMNEMKTDPNTGQLIIYDDDDVTPLLQANIYEDVDENQAYRGKGIEKRKRLL